MKQKLAITTVLTLATLSACVLGNEPGPDPEGSNYLNVRDAHKRQIQEKTHQEQQLTEASVMLHAAMSDGDIVANPFNDNGENPYVFVSEEARRAFYQLLDDAGLTVRISLATMQEIAQSPSGAEQSTSKSDQAERYCGPGHECSSVGYCDGGIVDCSYGYCNVPGSYGAYTTVDDYIPGSMTPFSAEVHLPYYASVLGDYNFNYNSPRELYIDTVTTSSSADRSKHRCCYWFWGYPSWTIQCSPYFYNQL